MIYLILVTMQEQFLYSVLEREQYNIILL